MQCTPHKRDLGHYKHITDKYLDDFVLGLAARGKKKVLGLRTMDMCQSVKSFHASIRT